MTAPHGVARKESDKAERTGTALPLLTQQRTLRSTIAEALVDAGVDTVFGMPGGHTIPIFDALFASGWSRSAKNRWRR
jgi:hypothetical protein